MKRTTANQRGVTLVEVVIVGVLALVVVLALTGFYVNSQATWIEASAQAVTQREVTFVVQAITDSVHGSYSADVSVPHVLRLYNAPVAANPAAEKCHFQVNAADSLIHLWVLGDDRGPLCFSKVTRFDVTSDGTAMVKLLSLELRTAQNRLISESTDAAMYNRP